EHRLAPDLAGTYLGDHALMHAFNPGVHFTALALADTHARLAGQLDQCLHARVATPFGQPNLFDPSGMMTQQRLDRVQAVDFLQVAHDLTLRFRAPEGLDPPEAGLPSALRFDPPRLGFSAPRSRPPLPLASASSAFFSSRL